MNTPAPRLIARSRLVRRLQSVLKTSHVFIRAPAGYGKSSLLRLLAAQQPNSFLSRLELDDADAGKLQPRLTMVKAHRIVGRSQAAAELWERLERRLAPAGAATPAAPPPDAEPSGWAG